MPATVNGIGTRYAGRKDASVVQATCPFCKRFTKLSSYETREWFCFVYIPLIPLRKFRILNDCAVCRRHHRLPLTEFRSRLENEIAPLRAAVDRAPSDAEARVRLVEGLFGFQMYTEAENAARDGLGRMPGNPRLNRLMAHLLALRGDLAGATPFYRQAAAAAPDDAEIRFALGRHLIACGETAEAVRELTEAWRRDAGNTQALHLLGEALFAEKRWNEALDAYQQILARHPEMASDRDLLRQMKACKEALGFPLTDAERKAGRRWWPFGDRKRLSTPRATSGMDGRRVAALLGIALGGIVIVGLGIALWKQRYADVWFDNGLSQPVRVTLNGESFPLPPGAPVKKRVQPGEHTIVVADAQGREMERYKASMRKLDLFDALTTDRLFVYDVAEAHIYQREEIGYAVSEADRTYRQSFIALRRFFEQQDVDYVFEAAPETMEVESGSSTTVRVALNVAKLDANRLGVIWFNEGKTQDAARAFRRALAAEPCSVPAHGNLLQVLPSREETAAEARKWLTECPGVESHRAYQQARIALGQRGAVLAEYQARLAAHPEVGANHYLYGRLVDDPERSMPLYRQAIELDPSLSWGRLALAYDMLALERDAEALEILEPTLRMPDRDTTVTELYAMAAIGAGAIDRARGALDEVEKALRDEDAQLWHARWLLLLAGGEFEAAEKRLKARELAYGERNPDVWALRAQLLRVQGDASGLKRILTEGRLRPDVAGLARTLLQEQALGAGQWQEAAAALDGLKPEEISYPDRVLAAWGLQMAGDRKGADERLAAVEAELEPAAANDAQAAAQLAMARHLRRRTTAEAVLAAARRSGFHTVPHAYFVLAAEREAAGDAAGARLLYEKARRRSLDLDVPGFAAAARAR
ncbi:MAG TPA: tetratricopeptide repeat protein [Thermoanaerobaculia bacterium]|jgi:tetratricopeptide (TPR) repeat protein|nr:tetratricopeptide repeat protein [Thermoanaerobaculia bacterium]